VARSSSHDEIFFVSIERPARPQPGDPIPDAWKVPLVGDPVRASAIDGWNFVVDLTPPAEHFDWQGHLNNSTAVKLLESSRILYITEGLGREVRRSMWETAVVVVRELHVSYESEGFPGEQYRCGVRAASRTEKAFVIEQELVERTNGRVLLQAWVVMLVVGRDEGRAVAIPDWYWERMEQLEGHAIPTDPPAPRRPWGPPRVADGQ
jgi:acyl-CoA thioesterase FadM